jgi:hypothetical protein
MMLTDNHAADLHSAQEPLHERRRAQGGELRRKWDDDHVVEAELIEQPAFLIERAEVRWAVIRVEYAARMGFERDQYAGGAGGAGSGDQWLQQRLVAAVDAVEGADCHVARSECACRREAEGNGRHAVKTARG